MSDTLSKFHRNLNSRGQALVEFALLLPILLLLVLGVIEFGRAFYMKNTLTNAVRHAARKAAVSTAFGSTDLNNWVKETVPASWQFSFVSPPTTSAAPASGSGAPITVKASLKFETIVPNFYFPFKNYTSISAQATMRYEQ